MFAIQRDNIFLKLPEKAVLSTTYFSQLINENKLKGAISIPLEIPIEGNEVFLNGITELKLINAAARSTAGIEGVKVYMCGVWILYGKMAILSTNHEEGTLSANLIVGLPGISSLDVKLQDLDWDVLGLPTDVDIDVEMAAKLTVFNTRQAGTWSPSDSSGSYNLPMVKNKLFYGNENAANPDYLGYLNNFEGYDVDASYIANKYYNYNAIVPWVYQLEVLRKGCLKGGYEFDWSLLPSRFEKALLPNNYDLVKMRPSLAIRVEQTTDLAVFGGGTPTAEVFHPDNESTGGNYDQNNLYNPASGKYIIPREGRYKIEYRMPLILGLDPDADFPYNWKVRLMKDGLVIDTNDVSITSGTSTPYFLAKRIYFDFTVDDIGMELQILVSHFDGGGPTITNQTVQAGSWLSIECLTTPKLNAFADLIDLGKCVPQDYTFREYINAFAATWNVEFEVDEYKKKVIAKLNETDISAEPIHCESFWRSNGQKPIVEIRSPKIKSLGYNFSSKDGAVGSFEDIDITTSPYYAGVYSSYKNLQNSLPAEIGILDKIALVMNQNAFYRCEKNPDFDFTVYLDQEFIWVFYKHNYFPRAIESSGEAMEMPMAPLMMTHKTIGHYALGVFFAIPWWDVEANSSSFGLTNKVVGLRSVFYYGPDIGSYPVDAAEYFYPFASPLSPGANQDDYSIEGLTMKLRTDDPGSFTKSIYDINWKNTIRVLNLLRWVRKKLNLRIDEISKWSFRNRLYMNGTVLMPEQITVSTTLSGENIEVECDFGIEEVVL